MADITVLDGAIGQELATRGDAKSDPLWSTAAMARQPELVRQLHAEYFDAGATWATTNTYALLPDRLEGTGLDAGSMAQVARDAAVSARDAHGSGKIAGSLGPLGASYRPDIVTTVEDAIAAYRPVVEALEGTANVFLAETVASLVQGAIIVEAMAELTDTPLWLAFTVKDDDGTRLRSGEHVAGIIDVARGAEALFMNCSRPEAITEGIPLLAMADRRVGAYANGFTHISEGFLGAKPTVDALSARDDLGPDEYAQTALGWVDDGATIVGGCCEVGPRYIKRLVEALKETGHTIV